jgi:hypothetical protein
MPKVGRQKTHPDIEASVENATESFLPHAHDGKQIGHRCRLNVVGHRKAGNPHGFFHLANANRRAIEGVHEMKWRFFVQFKKTPPHKILKSWLVAGAKGPVTGRSRGRKANDANAVRFEGCAAWASDTFSGENCDVMSAKGQTACNQA